MVMARIGSLLILLVAVSMTRAADWPQWLGPHRDGSSTEKVVPWKGAPKVLWRQPVGEGNSSPIVADGRVFLHCKVKDTDKTEEEVIAFDAKSGKELWRTAYARPAFKSFFGNGPRATPTMADGKLYTYGITGMLTCWNATDGKQLWQIDALEKFEAKNIRFGASSSPLVEGKSVLVNVGGTGASVVAFDRDSGATIWKSRDDKASYASPIAIGHGKNRQVVFLTASGVVSLNPADGAVYWDFPLRDRLFESSTTPLLVGDILLASSITYGSAGLRVSAQAGKPVASETWTNPSLTSYFTTPVAVGKDHLYLVTGTPPLYGGQRVPPRADLHCVEAGTGKVLWKKEKVGRYHAGLMRTGDNKLLMLEDQGALVLIDPGPKAYNELARSKVCEATWSHPALADGKLYLRDNKEIICLQMSE
jgi:outer membrane protein assembly factor BamB